MLMPKNQLKEEMTEWVLIIFCNVVNEGKVHALTKVACLSLFADDEAQCHLLWFREFSATFFV